MATYIPNATQTTEPVESRTVESAALEFRTLKASINERIEDVQDNLDAEIVNRIAGDANLQTQTNAQDVRLQAIEAALLAIGEGGLPGTVYVQRLSGTGAQTSFTLNVSVPSSALIDVFINGMYQNKNTFTIVDDVLTFSEAPPAGTDNVEVVVSITIANVETDASLVSFRATDSTVVVRTVQDKMREWVSVKDFGAVCDGVADDTAAIQAARTEASIGRSVDFQGKTYSADYWANLAPLATEWIHGGPTNYTADQQSTKPLTWAKNFVGLPMTQLGYKHYAAVWDSYTKAGEDIQSGATAVFRMNSYSTNTIGTDFNKTNQVALVANSSALSATASASVEAINAISSSLYTGALPQIVVGIEVNASAVNPPGFFGDASKAYSVGCSSNWGGDTQDGTIGVASGTSDATYSWLHGFLSAGAKTTGLTVTRNGPLRPAAGVWIASASTYGIYVGGKPLYSMNPGQGGDYSYAPAVGIALGQCGATSSNSHKLRLISTSGASAEQNFDLYLNSSSFLSFDFAGANKFGIDQGGNVYIQGSAILGTRKIGYTAMTGAVNRAASYSTSTITLQQLAERVAAMQADLTSHGIIGA